jgi:TatD DNase family protein
MQLVDTHCHIHDSEFYPDNKEAAYKASIDAGVAMVCVGTDVRSSQEAVAFAASHQGCYPVIGIHPHDAKSNDVADIAAILQSSNAASVIGIGEIGLDYYYNHSPKETQRSVLEAQIQLALDHNLPISFHIREAFDDFWPIFDNFHGIRGVMHSFTDSAENMQKGLERGLYVGVNGICTFTKDATQRELLTSVPLDCLLLETDAPFLTPAPLRGKMNIPAYVGSVAEFQAHARGMSLESLVNATTANAKELFGVAFSEQHHQLSAVHHSDR